VAYNLPRGTLIIFYENPWSNYNFAGVCVYPKMIGDNPDSEIPKTKLKDIYWSLYKAHPNRWPRNCVLLDNYYTKKRNFWDAKGVV
jgi:hypothetical protein